MPAERSVDSPLGPLTVVAEDGAVTALLWQEADNPKTSNLLVDATEQLAAYFAGELRDFDLPLAPAGTEFQRAVWDRMLAIPYGEVRRYGDLANDLDSVARAVGGACGINPLPIIIPCHRVVAGTGLGGFSGAGGTRTKRFLLDLEMGTPALPGLA